LWSYNIHRFACRLYLHDIRLDGTGTMNSYLAARPSDNQIFVLLKKSIGYGFNF